MIVENKQKYKQKTLYKLCVGTFSITVNIDQKYLRVLVKACILYFYATVSKFVA